MHTTKDKQLITFHLDDGKTVQYNLSTGQTIGKRGKPVQSLNSQLKGYSIREIIESFENEAYRKFFSAILSHTNNYMTNMGTLLKYAKEYTRAEQYFTAGISVKLDFYTPISEIPKGLIKLCRNYNVTLTSNLLRSYLAMPNEMNWAFAQEYYFLTPAHLAALFNASTYIRDKNGNYGYRYYINLLKDFGYDHKALIRYIDNLAAFEAQERIFNLITEIYDYANMMQKLSNKFEKYPRNFLTTHAIAVRNYNRLQERFEEEDFHKHYVPEYNCTFDEYCFIYPETTQQIKDEAVQQHNCVASYIKRVIEGTCHILFLRNKFTPDTSLVTIEVRDGRIVQAKGIYNRDVYASEQKAIDKFNKKFSKLNNNEKEKIAV